MPRRYYKRYKMEFDLKRSEIPACELPDGFRWEPWDAVVCDEHAMVKFRSFQNTVDAEVFPSFREYQGCKMLMQSISQRMDFLPAATWLAVSEMNSIVGPVPVGTIQGVTPTTTVGAIQNLGVVPEFRGFGLGTALLVQSLVGFRDAGLKRVTLSVTSRNQKALMLYHRLGFRTSSTSYRSVSVTKEEFARNPVVTVS